MNQAQEVALELLHIVITKAKNGEDWKADLKRLTNMAKTEPAAKRLVDKLLKTLLANKN